MPFKAGTVDDFDDSLAAAMEAALIREYDAVKHEDLPDMGEEDRRLMLVAIAQGIVRYFLDNLDALQISVETTQVTGEPGAPVIRSENPNSIAVSGGGNIGVGAADVTQIAAADNRILSRGTATVDTIDFVGTLYP